MEPIQIKYHHSDETKRKISEALKGRHHTEEEKAQMSKARQGHIVSAETRRKMSEALKGRVSGMEGKHHTPETKAKMSAAQKGERNHNYGKPRSAESRAKASAALKGEKHPCYGKSPSVETRAKMGAAAHLRWQNPEYREHMVSMLRGRETSPETREKLSKALKGKPSPIKGKHLSEETKKRQSESLKEGYAKGTIPRVWLGKAFSDEHRTKMSKARKGKPFTAEHRENISKAKKGKPRSAESVEKTKQYWADPEWKNKQISRMSKGIRHRKTKPEKVVEDILNTILPKQYIYVGSGHGMVVKGCLPDFVHSNGRRKVIEMFGDFWHSPEKTGKTREKEEADRINAYRKHGWECLVIWQHELDEDRELLIKRILQFHRRRYSGKKVAIQPCLL